MKTQFKLFIVAMVLMATASASAQITTGESYATVLKTGNRPSAGDWGVYVGIAYSDFESIFAPDISFEGFPLVNVKYYISRETELRLGLQFQGTTTMVSGSADYDEDDYSYVSSFKDKTSTRTNRIKPGVAYHFSNRNLLDVYMGVEVPIGWNNSSISYYETEFASGDYDDTYSKMISNNPFILGAGAFIGLQCFVADLPLAIGIEYGVVGIKEFGSDKTKLVEYDADGNKQTTYTYGTESPYYDSLKSTRNWFSNDARVTITYYFKSK